MLKNLTKGRKGFLTGVVLTAMITLPFTTLAATVQQSIKVTYNGIKVTLNGESVTLKDASGNVLEPFNYNGSVYVPIRGVSESLGMNVSYDSASKTVAIVNEGPNGAMPPGGQPPDGQMPVGQPTEGGSDGGGTSTDSSAETGDQSTADDTGLTMQVTQGPYYVTGTSQLTNGILNYDNLTGTPIKVQGYVYAGATGATPIAGAKVEIWHADDTGNYHPNSNGSASNYSSDEISLRGYVLTDENGYYEYNTRRFIRANIRDVPGISIPTRRPKVTQASLRS